MDPNILDVCHATHICHLIILNIVYTCRCLSWDTHLSPDNFTTSHVDLLIILR